MVKKTKTVAKKKAAGTGSPVISKCDNCNLIHDAGMCYASDQQQQGI